MDGRLTLAACAPTGLDGLRKSRTALQSMSDTARLTDEQTKAVQARNTSVSLAAGAGCGKTYVLTERFLSHLEPSSTDRPEPAAIHQLIAITFTDAAAREMRTRIREKCYDRLQRAKSIGDQDYWLRLLRAIETARISTIHSFCAALLRTHAIAAELDPGFGVMEQGEADVLMSETLDDVLRERLAAGDEDTLNLAAALGLSSLKTQLRAVLAARHEPHFRTWCDANADQLVAKWKEFHEREAFPAAVAGLAELPEVDEILRLLRDMEPPSKKSFADARAELLERLPKLSTGEISQQQLADLRSMVGVQTICSTSDWPEKQLFNRYRDACSALRKEIDKCLKLTFDSAAAKEAAALGLAALRLAGQVADAYDAAKSRIGKLDFDDLLAKAHELLSNPRHRELQRQLSGELRLLLVDEFQDTDRLQVELVRCLCGDALSDGRLFFVGDMKQSIYRFRGAQPEVFLDLERQLPAQGQLKLTKNFRSQPAILNFVNALFHNAFGGKYVSLQVHRKQSTPEPAVEFLWTRMPEKRNSRIKGAVRAAREQEARWIARRLRQLIDDKAEIVTDGNGGKRRVELGDIAILFRALSDVDIYEMALRDYGLDYYLVGGHAFYAQQEIYDVLNLLRAIASPADEISLAGVLRSPMFSLADETLFWLIDSGGSLNDGLFAEQLPAELAPEEQRKAGAAAKTLQFLREHKDSLPIASLLDEAFARTAYDAALLGEFLGERKLANLQKLQEQARVADLSGTLDLSGFIIQLAQFVASQPKESLAATMSESANVIRLMTIHHAKGLEFPLVVVPDVDRPQIYRRPAAALHPTLGPLVSLAKDNDQEQSSSGMDLYCASEKRADADERTRLLYVACTRAADYLMLSSSIAGFDAPESDWMKLIARKFDLALGQFVGKLPAGYQSPRVLVTDKEPATEHRPAGRSRGPDLVNLVERASRCAAGETATGPRGVLPIPADTATRRQFAVSRLSGRIVGIDPAEEVDLDVAADTAAGQVDSVDARGLGILIHAVLQRITPGGEDSVDRLCEQLAQERVPFEAARAAELARDMVMRFIASPRWRQMASAAEVHRELEFLLAWPLGKASADSCYFRGFFDCVYRDSSGWHLIDYKSNNVQAAAVSRLAGTYALQMCLYALAIERALGQRPAEIVIHFLRPGVEHVFPWDEAARQKGIALVNQALQRAATRPAPFDSVNPEL
jgi:ATP-dependent helicase/nuclease subunit A